MYLTMGLRSVKLNSLKHTCMNICLSHMMHINLKPNLHVSVCSCWSIFGPSLNPRPTPSSCTSPYLCHYGYAFRMPGGPADSDVPGF